MVKGLHTIINFKKEICLVGEKNAFIGRHVQGKNVLSIGCVDMIGIFALDEKIKEGKYQFAELSKYAKHITGIDINQKGVDLLREKGFDAHCLDITDSLQQGGEGIFAQKWDTVLLSHVIEHVPDLYGFLGAIFERLDFNEIIIGVPNAYHIGNLKNAARGKEVISNDHYYTFTPVTLLKLLEPFPLKNIRLYSNKNWLSFSEAKKPGDYFKVLFRKFENRAFKGLGDLIAIAERDKV